MKTTIHINGIDPYTKWGVTMADGGLNALMLPPQSKDRISNESRLLNGKQVLNTSTLKSDRDVSLTFNVYAADHADFFNKINSFIDELLKGTAEFTTDYLPNTIFRLNYISSSQLTQLRGEMGKIIVKFNEPDPTNR